MNKFSLTLLLLMFFAITSCGSKTSGKKSTSGLPGTLEMGVSTTSEVEAEMGQPEKTYEMDEATMLKYGSETIKIDMNRMKGYYREPKEDEIYLQYWLQAWKDKKTYEASIPETMNPHGQMDYQLNNDDERITIVFNKESGIVKRVMFYGK